MEISTQGMITFFKVKNMQISQPIDEVKTYRSLKIAENVKKRLETNSNGFRNLEVVVLVKGK